MRGKTIQIFLTDGTPRGIKIAEITSNIERAVFIPRNKMNDAYNRDEVTRPGIYFLFGESEGSAKHHVYIGQSRNCIERIKSHDQRKDFWNYAVLIISKTESFTQTHTEYLEQLAIAKAYEANRYHLENGVSPKKFKVPETMEADLLDNFDTIKILLSTLGFTLFESIKKDHQSKKETFFCAGKDAKAEGEYQEDGFVVFKGSTANLEFTPSAGEHIKNLRSKLLETGIIKENSGVLVFEDDYLFGSPSAAACQVLGRYANGWMEWKNNAGQTLDEVKRQ